MNEEIKEILDYIKKWTSLNDIPMIIKLEDYITNLQKDLYYYQTYGADMLHKNNELEQRIDKAIEYIEPFVEYDTDIMFKGKMIAPVLSILRGDKE